MEIVICLLLLPLSALGSFCPRGCECDDFLLKTQCPSSDLDTVPILLNPGTRDLNLSHNRIKTILHGFNFYRDLLYLDLSHNEIVSLGADHFAFQSSLVTLDVSNNKISVITNRAFVGLSSLANLVLSDNYIELVEPNAIFALTNLATVDFSNNRLQNFSTDFFSKQQHLKVLNLCKNAITNIPVLDQLHELQDLDLCFNKIAIIYENAFKNAQNLIKISLNDNIIFSIHENASNGLELLEFLDLKNNKFQTIPREIFIVMKNLEELDISYNLFVSIPKGSFADLENLKNLQISRCPNLTTVDPEAFISLSALVTLEISFNPQLSSLPSEVFKPLKNLQHLNLRGNLFTGLPHSDVKHLQLQTLDIRENQLHCNCSLKWLQNFRSNQSRNTKIEDIYCWTPDDLKGQSLYQLNDFDLDCSDNTVTIISVLVAIVSLFTAFVLVVLFYKNRQKIKLLLREFWPRKSHTWKESTPNKVAEDEGYNFYTITTTQPIPVSALWQELRGDQWTPMENSGQKSKGQMSDGPNHRSIYAEASSSNYRHWDQTDIWNCPYKAYTPPVVHKSSPNIIHQFDAQHRSTPPRPKFLELRDTTQRSDPNFHQMFFGGNCHQLQNGSGNQFQNSHQFGTRNGYQLTNGMTNNGMANGMTNNGMANGMTNNWPKRSSSCKAPRNDSDCDSYSSLQDIQLDMRFNRRYPNRRKRKSSAPVCSPLDVECEPEPLLMSQDVSILCDFERIT